MMIGACGKPIRRESCETVISVVDGMGVLLASEAKDAIFRLPPHEVIAQNPLSRMHTSAKRMSRSYRCEEVGIVRPLFFLTMIHADVVIRLACAPRVSFDASCIVLAT